MSRDEGVGAWASVGPFAGGLVDLDPIGYANVSGPKGRGYRGDFIRRRWLRDSS
ncbi:MAG: hypothetical protein PHT60_09035 [Acidiphilium sp.]|nr:hypothetical protein [Acidiphilium sp.]MDD4935905.1 hypothetical protein [Acidiphilium sp.]